MKKLKEAAKIYFQSVKKTIKIIIWSIGIFSKIIIKLALFFTHATYEGTRTRLGYKMFIYCLAWALASNLLFAFDGAWAGSPEATIPIRHLPEIEDVDFDSLPIPKQIRIIAEQEDFNDVDLLLDLAYCESRYDPYALGNNGTSIDRGLFQINDYFQKQVKTECSMDVGCSTRWTINKLKQGGHNLWSCYKIIR